MIQYLSILNFKHDSVKISTTVSWIQNVLGLLETKHPPSYIKVVLWLNYWGVQQPSTSVTHFFTIAWMNKLSAIHFMYPTYCSVYKVFASPLL